MSFLSLSHWPWSAMLLPALAVFIAQPGIARAGDGGPATRRPAIHFTPARHWMNDPNGLIYHNGTYHLFFQHNPYGNTWGNISWGHATSPDLAHWQRQPLAIPDTPTEMAYSGSVVFDANNSSGLGSRDNPPLVAIYTSAYQDDAQHGRNQAQSLAYSTDDGQTWTRYGHNPVLDRHSLNFRDPKVFRYTPDHGQPYWVMAAVEAREQRVLFYRSNDLKSWHYLSDFGPANAVRAQWECPDMFQMPIEGKPGESRWILVVNINPGSISGGSGTQYFVGDFDGKRFVSKTSVSDADATRRSLGDFESGFGGWHHSVDANGPDGFGDAPVNGERSGQPSVHGFYGNGIANSRRDGDAATGRLISPDFVIDRRYLNFLLGGTSDRNSDGLTGVRLIVNGRVVRQATGTDTEFMAWRSFDVADLAGRIAHLEIVDTAHDGHVLADAFALSDHSPRQRLARYLWLDYGRDYYAAVSFNGMADDNRVMLGWMNNWDYGSKVPTAPWRGAMALPRRVTLVDTPDGARLRQSVVASIDALAEPATFRAHLDNLSATPHALPAPASHDVARVDMTLTPAKARDIGISVLGDDTVGTRIGYDADEGAVYIDRRDGGDASFSPAFASREQAPATPDDHGDIHLSIYLDKTSVEVFVNDGQVTLTDLVFPPPGSDRIAVYADHPSAAMDVAVHPMQPTMYR